MRRLVLAAGACLLAAAAQAQTATPEQREAFGVLEQRARLEFTVFFNCLALDPFESGAIAKTWRKMVTETIPVLQEAGYSAAEIIAFVDRADERAMMMSDRRFSEVISFCHANGDASRKIALFDIIRLDREAEDIFEGADGAR